MVGISIVVIVIRANLQMVIKLATLTAVIAVALPAGVANRARGRGNSSQHLNH